MRALALVAAAALLLAGGAAAQCTTIENCDDCATIPTICATCAVGFTAVDAGALWCVAGGGGGAPAQGAVRRITKHSPRTAAARLASCWWHRVCEAGQ